MTRIRRLCTNSVFALVFLAAPGAAEELAGGGEPLRILEISPEVCARLAPYVSTDEATFKPGVAADGSAVAPADLDDGYGYKPPTTYRFPLKIKPIAGTGTPYDYSDLYIADVLFDLQTGRVSIDGQDVSGGNRALAEACAHRRGH
ncbi:MAG: hypothetical protein Q7S99_16570 [Parvibaculum sp.]|nr:hypothetical protein [Parvibaculum sp.]